MQGVLASKRESTFEAAELCKLNHRNAAVLAEGQLP